MYGRLTLPIVRPFVRLRRGFGGLLWLLL